MKPKYNNVSKNSFRNILVIITMNVAATVGAAWGSQIVISRILRCVANNPFQTCVVQCLGITAGLVCASRAFVLQPKRKPIALGAGLALVTRCINVSLVPENDIVLILTSTSILCGEVICDQRAYNAHQSSPQRKAMLISYLILGSGCFLGMAVARASRYYVLRPQMHQAVTIAQAVGAAITCSVFYALYPNTGGLYEFFVYSVLRTILST